jgi:hypothetical protein
MPVLLAISTVIGASWRDQVLATDEMVRSNTGPYGTFTPSSFARSGLMSVERKSPNFSARAT